MGFNGRFAAANGAIVQVLSRAFLLGLCASGQFDPNGIEHLLPFDDMKGNYSNAWITNRSSLFTIVLFLCERILSIVLRLMIQSSLFLFGCVNEAQLHNAQIFQTEMTICDDICHGQWTFFQECLRVR